MNPDIKKRIIVIGGNAAGAAAATNAKRTCPESEVVIYEKSPYISTGTCEIPYVLSGEIENYGKIVFFNSDEFWKKKGVQVHEKHSVLEIKRKTHIVVVRNNETGKLFEDRYDKLILATGSKAEIPEGLECGCKNVFTLKNIPDLRRADEFINCNNSKNALIIGSGYIGLETAEALKKRGLRVAIIEKEELPLPAADIEIRERIRKLLEKENIRFIGEAATLKFSVKANEADSLNINGRFVEADLFIICTGVKPDVFLAEYAEIKTGETGAIKVNSRMQTSDPNILAAGDCVEVSNFITGNPDYIPLATLAYKQAQVAGINSAGGSELFGQVVKNLAVQIFDKSCVMVGLSENEIKRERKNYVSASVETDDLVSVMPQKEKLFGKIMTDKFSGNILGASFWGSRSAAGLGDLVSFSIKNKINFRRFRDTEFNYTPLLSPFHNILSVLSKKLEKESYG